MSALREIRADYDRSSLVVYQAFNPAIADAALAAGRFVSPFSFGRMTWIKPSFLWMMERSNWGKKPNQERILAVRVTRTGWEEALSRAVLTDPDASVYRDPDDWRRQADAADVRVQWDPERSLRGEKLPYRSIQVGIGRSLIAAYVDDWIVGITDVTPLVSKVRGLMLNESLSRAQAPLPREHVYPVSGEIRRRLGME